ncbi:flagellar hook-basal body complex protein [Litorivicinus lipolyticus]|uniref:Flagellar hook protein FlgE n=1 Tax=Litorivicinus lipolyticus TaxID=418701 RepID=A0A5Q2QD15_9GAMM|nr:flagellar hook protein FlgE [Litorivicinus lipolyticus]QGG80212.1 flagellar hook-basal body complex protein [Litorivicinus lipolyticus]
MSINTALTGLRAAQSQLDVISNNIANASTTGFKRSRAEFADVYASGVGFSGATSAGNGVTLAAISQQFDQGNLNYTNNSLDMAMSGEGMFIQRDGDVTTYTRSGAMQLDDDGFIISNQGASLMGYLADAQGNVQAELNPIRIDSAQQPPQATTDVQTQLNLDSESAVITSAFDPSNEQTFNYLTTVAVYDSLGRDYTMQQYFVKDADNSWRMYPRVDGTDVMGGGTPYVNVDFSADGQISGVASAGTGAVDVAAKNAVTLTIPTSITGAASTLAYEFNLTTTTQYGTDFSVSEVSQDGYTAGRLASLDVNDNGDILARYSNGRSALMAQIAIADFTNMQGLSPSGDSAWLETSSSGPALIGKPGTGTLGNIQAGALEESNVDTSEELVSLITAQRNYQANAKVIETAETVTQAILNLR